MQAGSATRIEAGIDRAASGLFGIASGYAAWTCLAGVTLPERGAVGAAAGALAYVAIVRVLRSVQPNGRRLPVPVFDVREIEAVEPEELLLTERFDPPPGQEPLILDDILGELNPDSRVVRLFDPAAMPTAGELNDRIQRHLVRGAPQAPPQDASQALHDALAELRRSLR